MDAKIEMKKVIGALKARIKYHYTNTGPNDDFPEDEYRALCVAIDSFENWLIDEDTEYLPCRAEQLIFMQQFLRCEDIPSDHLL